MFLKIRKLKEINIKKIADIKLPSGTFCSKQFPRYLHNQSLACMSNIR